MEEERERKKERSVEMHVVPLLQAVFFLSPSSISLAPSPCPLLFIACMALGVTRWKDERSVRTERSDPRR